MIYQLIRVIIRPENQLKLDLHTETLTLSLNISEATRTNDTINHQAIRNPSYGARSHLR